jgi:DNA-binding response OmpR family regulator
VHCCSTICPRPASRSRPCSRASAGPVSVAHDGATALRLTAEQDAAGDLFDLLLVDWQMRGMDGLRDAAKRLGIALS